MNDDRVDLAVETAEARVGAMPEPRIWRCFHCDDVFRNVSAARVHFGATDASAPACRIKAGAEGSLLRALRCAEEDAAAAWEAVRNETVDAVGAYHAQTARHVGQVRIAEELGYERGLADGLDERRAMEIEQERLRDACRHAAAYLEYLHGDLLTNDVDMMIDCPVSPECVAADMRLALGEVSAPAE